MGLCQEGTGGSGRTRSVRPTMSHVELESGAREKAAVDIQTRRMAWHGEGQREGEEGTARPGV